MPTLNLADADGWAVVNALNVARERYQEDAKVMRDAGQPRLVEQFERQAADVERIKAQLIDVL